MLMRSGDRGEGEEGGEREAGGPAARAGQHREEAPTSYSVFPPSSTSSVSAGCRRVKRTTNFYRRNPSLSGLKNISLKHLPYK